ncbi:MAG: hypothetical protein JWS10_639 [Cypionkella sp.]|uniref:PIN domain-containing protein n=1 Tax=Cypionkella sp. TaxID=2811411 RepID=UPI002639C93C|nr:PIN domain-containing protein [Cypionkella sp.]MDB5658024.1 hypothetical protein [Cypionkella sp.]
MAINLFLDANILLSFYALSNADVKQLEQLKPMVAAGDIALYVNRQLCDEVERNREKKIQEAFKLLKSDTFKCQVPAFVRGIAQFGELQDILKLANQKHAELMPLVDGLIDARTLDADIVIADLFNAVTVAPHDAESFSLALDRFRRGNPPGKKAVTIGDELHWEFLLAKVPPKEDLHLVSSDGDFASSRDNTKVNSFLANEWRLKKESNLFFYRDLSTFFLQHVPAIKLANETKLNGLIAELGASGSFAETHAIIAKFPSDADFTDAQITDLIQIRQNNAQISWIVADPDVREFYIPIIAKYEQLHPAPDDLGDEIPF